MTLWEAFVLGVVQGATEFLPVSSSGHLVLVHHAMGALDDVLVMDALLHLGSLVVIIGLFWRELWTVARALLPGQAVEERREGLRLLLFLVVGTVPLVIAGLTLRHVVEETFTSTWVTPLMLIVTGVLLLAAEFAPKREEGPVTTGRALGVGLAQCFAMLPGLSRSGVTIAVGLALGLSRLTAARFSFLLAIPALAGASLLGLKGAFGAESTSSLTLPVVVVGVLASMVATWASVVLFLRFVRQRRLTAFAVYVMTLGVVVFWLQ